MTKLSVNVNKLATLRNSRGKNNPDVVRTALDIVKFGADGITVHPRPDERHIRRSDVYALKKVLDVELNIEGYPTDDFLEMVIEVNAAQCTLVPDPPEALTSNAGWKVAENQALLKRVAEKLKSHGIRISVFVDPKTTGKKDLEILKQIGVDRIELYTEAFAETFSQKNSVNAVLQSYVQTATDARAIGLGINAGHDLDLHNLRALIQAIPWIDEVSIGHALICDALYLGLNQTIQRYREEIRLGSIQAK